MNLTQTFLRRRAQVTSPIYSGSSEGPGDAASLEATGFKCVAFGVLKGDRSLCLRSDSLKARDHDLSTLRNIYVTSDRGCQRPRYNCVEKRLVDKQRKGTAKAPR